MQLLEIWHYHRPDLAKLYLNTLNAGLVTSTTIFAPHRAGKTSFLLKDLTPAATKAGYTVIYVDLWQTKLSPGIAIVRALEIGLDSKNIISHVMNNFRAPIKTIKAKAELLGANIAGEIELGKTQQQLQTDIALQIDTLIATLCKKKPVLLLIDEAQELAKNKETEAIATALRTAITRNQHRLRVVFTGSSRTKLAHVFSNSTAPLYSTGAAIANFPQLNQDFVEFIAQQFEKSTGRTLPILPAWQAFIQFKQQPEPFLIGIVDMVLNPSLTLADAMTAVANKLIDSENHEGVWATFNATQKALLRLLAQDPGLKPFSKAVVLKLRTIIGIDSLDATHIQRAMSKLSTIVFKSAQDTYEFENDAFANWIKTLDD